ncbi:uncharacterized protein IL334_002405 [Kwoniella shivajii]|uniref:COP9 signalosome complex subunit 3 n=1 Tax=Kwoniella shivajii TaxID=564305 RepID=A0ABZ1CVU7_9TREE|nr:hypothetical protein IL334_002405 [Kwoniella shivajii]
MTDNQPAASSSASGPSSGASAGPAPAPAHAALPPLPRAPSKAYSSRTTPLTSSELINMVSATDSLQYVDENLIPTLQSIAEGKPFESTKMKEKERKEHGELILTCGDDGSVYSVEDTQVNRMSAGLVYIISARLHVFKNTPSQYNNELFTFATRLCNLGDSQQFYTIHKRVVHLAWGMLRLAQQLNKVAIAVPAISSLIQKTCSAGIFSGLYSVYLEACLLSRNFDASFFVLDQVFLNVKSLGSTYLEVLTYYHHAGLISAAVKDFERAKRYFVTAVSLPTTTTSAIQLACAKRAILCELLDTGKRIIFPRYTASTVNRAIEKNASIYIDLAKDYESNIWSGVRDIAGKSDFAQDCNNGLIEQVLKSITKRRIIQLRQVYSRMTMNDLVARVGPSSRETVETITAILGEMITSNAIIATISPRTTPATSIVTFFEDQQDYSSSRLAEANLLASKLENELSEMSQRLGIKKEYLKKQANIIEYGGGGKGSGKARMDDFDGLMAAEEYASVPQGAGGGGIRGVGGNYGDAGF